MYTCQCEGFQMGQSSGVLLKEVAGFHRFPFLLLKFHCIPLVDLSYRRVSRQVRETQSSSTVP